MRTNNHPSKYQRDVELLQRLGRELTQGGSEYLLTVHEQESGTTHSWYRYRNVKICISKHKAGSLYTLYNMGMLNLRPVLDDRGTEFTHESVREKFRDIMASWLESMDKIHEYQFVA